jgi:hypothetical protein
MGVAYAGELTLRNLLKNERRSDLAAGGATLNAWCVSAPRSATASRP